MCEGEGVREQTQGESVRVRVRGSKHGRVCEGEGEREQYSEGVRVRVRGSNTVRE